MKKKSVYKCSSCFFESIKWLGCCSQCNAWNSFVLEDIQSATFLETNKNTASAAKLYSFDDISVQKDIRYTTNVYEWDRVMGGGIVPGSLLLLSGDPGIGKSTLLLQMAIELSVKNEVIYFSTEESLAQIKLRLSRVYKQKSTLQLSDESNMQIIIATIEKYTPKIIIIDSIQNVLYDSEKRILPGSINQLKEITFELEGIAKQYNVAIIITSHITKDGSIAGPKLIEHLVDGVFYLQKEEQGNSRILRSIKNRFGSVHETGFFAMNADGMEEIKNINEHLLHKKDMNPGSVLVSSSQGSRIIFIELQALTIISQMPIPQRVITGIEHKQVVLIAAILEKYVRIKLSKQDIFFKISGEVSIRGNAIDLGIALALCSSYFSKALLNRTIALAEISLTGEIKPVKNIEEHLSEIDRFGFSNIIIAEDQVVEKKFKTKLIRLKKISDIVQFFT